MSSTTPLGPQPPYLLHPSITSKLDPIYTTFYNENLIDKQQVHLQPVSASRTSGVLIPGAGPKLPVGSTQDFLIKRQETTGPDIPIRVFTPSGETPEKGWSVMMYYHGGGWVLGNIDTENVVCTNLCNRARCLVITVDYRLAPENPYPSAVHDSWESLLYLRLNPHDLPLDLTHLAIGGSSAGGNLAAILTQKLLSRPSLNLHPKVQLLIVPVTDNTALPSNNTSYKENEFVPALPAEKMLWYRRHYLPDEKTWSEAEASPVFWEGEWGALPKALVVVGELDVLRTEGEVYVEKLRKGGVEVDLRVMKGMPHPFLAMDGVLQQGKDTITAMVEKLVEAFST